MFKKTAKDSHTNPKEENVIKSVDNGDIITLDDESIRMNLCQKTRFALDQSNTDDWISKEKLWNIFAI